VRKADNPPPSSADVTESGSLNLPEPSGPHRPVMGMVCLFLPFESLMKCHSAVWQYVWIISNIYTYIYIDIDIYMLTDVYAAIRTKHRY
jgi:hypothetical protein